MRNQQVLKLERKCINMLLGLNLLRLQKSKSFNVSREKRAAERNLKKLMRAAYEIPFYRKRFDQAGLKPSDFRTTEDPYKFPVLTKDDLRHWMDEEEGKEEYKYFFHHFTGPSTIFANSEQKLSLLLASPPVMPTTIWS